MSDVGVDVVFDKDTCKMVPREMMLIRGAQIETRYKLLGNTINDGCNSYVVLEDKNEEDMTLLSL